MRPISSTVNLAQQKQTTARVEAKPNQAAIVAQAVAEENQRLVKSQRPMASAKVYQPQKINPIF